VKIALFGTRGIPNHHGGFEQFAEWFGPFLAKKGHEVYVYCSHNHPYQKKEFHGVKLIHCYDPAFKLGTAGQFIYDLNCLLDARKRKFDVLLQLGYTSSSVWHPLLPKKTMIATNMDGLEWKRLKYHPLVRRFLVKAEAWAVKSSDHLIADNTAIETYLKEKYGVCPTYIPYGVKIFEKPKATVLTQCGVAPGGYDLIIARMEPENNIETILDGVAQSKIQRLCLVVGKYEATPFGRYVAKKYQNQANIRFIGGIYNQELLDNLRHYAHLYFHGHSVGGTNPSLLEAMGCRVLIAAHDNRFNKAILGPDALYFTHSHQVCKLLDQDQDPAGAQAMIEANADKIRNTYSWDKISGEYLSFLQSIYEQKLMLNYQA
jgi:glycosyltransferase involved in cell wall biosynthesis